MPGESTWWRWRRVSSAGDAGGGGADSQRKTS